MGRQSPCGPSAGAPSFAHFFKLNSRYPTVKITTAGYQTLECFIATLPTYGVHGRLVRVDLQNLGCELLGPTGGAIAISPDP